MWTGPEERTCLDWDPGNRPHSSRSSRCLLSVTASLDKRRAHTEKLWAISLSSTLWTLLSMVWQRSSAWRALHISSTASLKQDLFYDHVNKARVWRPKASESHCWANNIHLPAYISIHRVHMPTLSLQHYYLHLCAFLNERRHFTFSLWSVSFRSPSLNHLTGDQNQYIKSYKYPDYTLIDTYERNIVIPKTRCFI